MTDTPGYARRKWVWEKHDSPKWRYGKVNRPIAGATHEKELARGKHPLQLYSLATPNGVKVTIMLEELPATGHRGAELTLGSSGSVRATSLAGRKRSASARPSSAGEWSIAPADRLKNNCTSAMTRAISRRKRAKVDPRGQTHVLHKTSRRCQPHSCCVPARARRRGDRVKRREFIAGPSSSAAWPVALRTQ